MRRRYRRIVRVLASGMFLYLASLAAAAEIHTWTDSTGQFSIKGKFVGLDQGKVTLAKEDGTEIEIELTKLSSADQTYAQEQARASTNPFKAVTNDPFKARTSTARPAPSVTTAGDTSQVITPSWSGASSILVSATGGGWQVDVGTPVAPGTSGPLANRPIPLPPRTHFFEKAAGLVVNPVSRRAVVGYHQSFPPDAGKRTRVVLCDLEKGKMLGSFKVEGAVLVPLALHDSGNLVLMRRDEQGGGNQDRLEVWRMGPSGVERTLKFIPYDDLKGDQRNVKWAEFLDAKRLATISNSGKLAIWEWESARPISYMDLPSGCTPALSPDRKKIAFTTGKDLGVLDVDAGQVIAMQTIPHVAFPLLLFSPSGKRIGCATLNQMYVWDTATGNLDREVPFYGVVVNGQALFTTDDHVLLGKSALIDLANQVKLWTYQGVEQVRWLGDVCWFVPNTNQNQAGALVPSSIPQPQVKDALQKALADPNFFVLRPGTTVKINLDGISDASQRDGVRAALEKRLAANGFKSGPNGTIELAAITEVGKEREIIYRTIGRGFPSAKSYKVTEYFSRVKFNTGGLTAWEASSVNIPFFARLKSGETMEEHLRAGKAQLRLFRAGRASQAPDPPDRQGHHRAGELDGNDLGSQVNLG